MPVIGRTLTSEKPESQGASRTLLDSGIDGFLLLWLFLATGALLPLLAKGTGSDYSPEANTFLRQQALFFVVVTPLLIWSRLSSVCTLLLRNPVLLLLLLWVWLSVTWSFAPEVTARRSLALTSNTLLACFLILRYDFERILGWIAWIFVLLLVASALFAILLPGLGWMPSGAGVRGIFTHKNVMGNILVLAVIIIPPAINHGRIPRLVGWLGLLLTAGLLLPTNSATAIVLIAAVLIVRGLIYLRNFRHDLAVVIASFAAALAVFLMLLVAANIDLVYSVLGRDPSLSGRVAIWQYVTGMIEARPLLGYGYNTFWEVEAFVIYATDTLRWDLPNAHNGFLDVTLGIGFIGLALLLIFCCTSILRTIKAKLPTDSSVVEVTLLLLCSYLFRAFSESNLFNQSSFVWILLVICVVALTPGLSTIRAHHSPSNKGA